jgi:small subunit ribosomal protein S18
MAINKRFKNDTPAYFDYKDVKTLQRFINMYGQIEPISKTNLSAKQQRQLAVAIKRARHLALMPFVISN